MSTSSPPSVPAVPVPPSPPPPLSGEEIDHGAVLKESVRVARWSALGSAKVLGDVAVDRAELAGLVSIKGRVVGGSLRSNGTLAIGGSVELSGALEVHGQSTFGASVRTATLQGRGTVSVRGPLTVSAVAHWEGLLEVAGDLTGGSVDFDGRFVIEGILAAAEVTGRLRGHSRVRSIRADRGIVLRRSGRMSGGGTLTVDQIEAQTVELEGVRAQLVRAQAVVVGPNCEIARIEGTIRNVHRSSTVGPVSRSPPPYGLTR